MCILLFSAEPGALQLPQLSLEAGGLERHLADRIHRPDELTEAIDQFIRARDLNRISEIGVYLGHLYQCLQGAIHETGIAKIL